MIADLYAQITPDNHNQILEYVASLQQRNTSGYDYTLLQIGRYVNIFVLGDNSTYWTIYDTCSHNKIHSSFDGLLAQLFITQLEN